MRVQLATKLLVRVSTLALFPAHVAAITIRAAFTLPQASDAKVTMGAALNISRRRRRGDDGAIVQNIRRFAVKGLGRDELPPSLSRAAAVAARPGGR